MKIKINFDGAANNNTKDKCPAMGIGLAVFVDDVYQEELSKAIHFEGKETNSSNVAEWEGCLAAFDLLAEIYDKESGDTYMIESDSQLIVRQFNGDYKVASEGLKHYYFLAKQKAKKIGLKDSFQLVWTPREYNKEADRLSKLGIANKPLTLDTQPVPGNH